MACGLAALFMAYHVFSSIKEREKRLNPGQSLTMVVGIFNDTI